jgi:Tol biopolymer transport system component
VLDFGLAKPTSGFAGGDAESALPTAAKTAEGMIVGTLNYMSPEQAQGKEVDHRSDIFSLGVVFYEMLTGRRPFSGENPAEILSSIIKDTPNSPSDLNPAVPRDLAKLVRRCLAKDPIRRYQSAIDLRNELEETKQDVDSGQAVVGAVPVQANVVPNWVWFLGAATALSLVAWMIWPRGESSRQTIPRLTNPVQLTSAIGVEAFPTWAPDGRTLAFQASGDIWVTSVEQGQPFNRTADHGGIDTAPSWSPDGRQLAFLSDRDGDSAVFVMSPLGGTSRRVGTFGGPARSLQWLAGGTKLGASITSGDLGVDFAEVLTVSTGETRRVPLPGRRSGRFHLRWSPDERYVAYVAALDPSNEVTQLWVLRIADGEATPVTDGLMRDLSPSWSIDSNTLYFVSNRGGSMDLWRLEMDVGTPKGEPERVTAGVGMRQAVFSPDGTRLAYVKGERVANLWSVPILDDRPATWADAAQLTFDEAYIEFVDVSPDGMRLLVSSNRSGNQDLWSLPAAGGEMQRLTTDLSPDWDPHWSPDGQQIAFYSNRSGNRDIWVMPTAGGAARQLTRHEGSDLLPAWSPDGTELVFLSDRSGNIDLWVLSVDTGEARRLTSGAYSAWSPSGRWVAFTSMMSPGLWRIPATGGDPELLSERGGPAPRWAPNEQEIYFLNTTRDGNDGNVWAVSPEDRAERAVTDLSRRAGLLGATALATDGRYLYFSWGSNSGDIWVMDVVTDESE